jgi:hypothetical protein
MTAGQPPFGPILSWHSPLRGAQSSQIEGRLTGIQTTLEPLRLEAERSVAGDEDDEEPRSEGERR